MLEKDYLRAMAENMARGIKDGRVEDDWKDLDPVEVLDRVDAIVRHVKKYLETGDRTHMAAAGSDTMIVWWHDKEGKL